MVTDALKMVTTVEDNALWSGLWQAPRRWLKAGGRLRSFATIAVEGHKVTRIYLFAFKL